VIALALRRRIRAALVGVVLRLESWLNEDVR